jgi:8-amino-7-oxononanoate synthase
MKNHPLQPFWPIEMLRKQDLWFHNEFPIESYDSPMVAGVAGHGKMLFLGSYSYLGLNNHPRINEAAKAAIDRFGTGANGVRLLAGTLQIHHELEAKIAEIKETEAAVVFSSGFMTNVSAIAALIGRNDTIVCDKLVHASIVDGCNLTRAKVVRFKHNDMNDLEICLRDNYRGRCLVIVDGVYSMDGDIANLPEISRLCRRYDASLMVDEAHSFGVIGKTGKGIEEHFNLPPDTIDIKMGTLSKSIPSAGGYIAGSRRLCEFLSLQARGFIYSGAMPASSAAAALEALHILQEEPWRVAQLHRNVEYFGKRLREAGFSYLNSTTAIFPIICGEDIDAWRLARHCQKRGIFVQAVPHPVVPKGLARLRAAVSATHTLEDLDYCIEVLKEGAQIIPATVEPAIPNSNLQT